MGFDRHDHQDLENRNDNDAHSQYLLGENADERVERGTVTKDGQNNSTGNNDWGQANSQLQSESFGTAFGSTPNVALNANDNQANVSSNEWKVGLNNPSTTGFDLTVHQIAAVDNTGTTDAYAADYVAVGSE